MCGGRESSCRGRGSDDPMTHVVSWLGCSLVSASVGLKSAL